ncbi:MAG: SIS domain-containing protein [Gammaproteobacteria bacterium]|nr:SIS domain-containing protein [Gammaproteobacteria bacterium]
MEPVDFIHQHAERAVAAINRAVADLDRAAADAAARMIDCLEAGGRILACGNGGSASDALHFSAELLNRYRDDRRPLAAIALNADVATLTAIANDFDYNRVFAKQVDALGRPGDLLLAITTSGNSGNVLAAIDSARRARMATVLLTGRDGGRAAQLLAGDDILLCVNDGATAHIQEAHGVIIHCLCALVEDHFIRREADQANA